VSDPASEIRTFKERPHQDMQPRHISDRENQFAV
jgi:hypothetical protein